MQLSFPSVPSSETTPGALPLATAGGGERVPNAAAPALTPPAALFAQLLAGLAAPSEPALAEPMLAEPMPVEPVTAGEPAGPQSDLDLVGGSWSAAPVALLKGDAVALSPRPLFSIGTTAMAVALPMAGSSDETEVASNANGLEATALVPPAGKDAANAVTADVQALAMAWGQPMPAPIAPPGEAPPREGEVAGQPAREAPAYAGGSGRRAQHDVMVAVADGDAPGAKRIAGSPGASTSNEVAGFEGQGTPDELAPVPKAPVGDRPENAATSVPQGQSTRTNVRGGDRSTGTAIAVPTSAPSMTKAPISSGQTEPANEVESSGPASTNNVAAGPVVVRSSEVKYSVPAGGAAEKFAANPDPAGARIGADFRSAVKSVLNIDVEEVEQSSTGIGIDTAKSAVTMPGSTHVRQSAPDATVVAGATSSADLRSDASVLPAPVALPSTAHRAVEAVLTVTDRFAARGQHSVNLQFSVAGADLNVRVELRAGEVHTTFRTDSAELRAALASEWQSVTTQSGGDRAAKLAPPVFTSTEQSGASFSGDGTSRHGYSNTRGSEEHPVPLPPPPAPAPSSTSAPAAAVAPTRTAATNAVHLHTLA